MGKFDEWRYGVWEKELFDDPRTREDKEECEICHGEGSTYNHHDPCSNCNGKGYLE